MAIVLAVQKMAPLPLGEAFYCAYRSAEPEIFIGSADGRRGTAEMDGKATRI